MDVRPHLLPLCLLAFAAPVAQAAVINADPSNYRALLATLAPGDTLQLASGTYTQGLPLDGRNGTDSQPLIIKGPEDQSAIILARDCCNTVQLSNTSHVQVMNLTLDGLGKDGPFAVDANGNTHHITLENLKIINHNGSQQTVGISSKGPAWNWVIRRNTIIDAGTGIYLGDSNGGQPFVAGLIEHNLIVDTIGYNMQIKHQNPRPTNVGLPAGDSRTIIRHNVFVKQRTTVGEDGARPNVLLGAFPTSGAGVNDVYEVYGNLFYRNPTEALFQGEGNLALYDNLFVNPDGSAVNIQAQNGQPRNISLFHNTVVATGNGLRVSGAAAGFTQRIVGNVSYAAVPVSGPGAQDNVTGAYASASATLNAPFAPIGTLDLFPRAGALTGAAIDVSAFGFTDGTKDFNGATRSGLHRGAYEGDGVNAGWIPAIAIKPVPGAAAPLVRPCPPPTVSVNGGTPVTTACP
jgi:hypothetical protein